MEQPFHTGGLGQNHTEIVLHLNNSLGQIDLVTEVHVSCIETILEGAEVRIVFYGLGGGILRRDTPEGAEGPGERPRG